MAWRVDACQIERGAMGRYSSFESLSEPGAEPISFQGANATYCPDGWLGLAKESMGLPYGTALCFQLVCPPVVKV